MECHPQITCFRWRYLKSNVLGCKRMRKSKCLKIERCNSVWNGMLAFGLLTIILNMEMNANSSYRFEPCRKFWKAQNMVLTSHAIEKSLAESSLPSWNSPSVRLPSNLDLQDLPTSCKNSTTSFNRFGLPCIKYGGGYTYTVRIPEPNLTYVFCIPPRCSSALHRAIALRVMELGNWDQQPIKNKNWSSLMFKANEFAPLLLNDSIPRFIVVRNPMARAVSAFIRTFQYDSDDEPKMVMYFEQWVIRTMRWTSSERIQIEPISWKQYKYPKSHLIPQTMFCGFSVRDVWKYFTIFKLEDKKPMADFMYNFMPKRYLYGWGASNASLYSLLMADIHVNTTQNKIGDLLSYLAFHRKRSDSKLESFYRNRDIFDRVATAYTQDIYLLNYVDDVHSLRKSLFGNTSY